jgi:hypothetical protein
MKNKKTTSLFAVVPILFLIVGSIVLSGCESSRVGPELPRPNPPAPPAQPLVLVGTVIDASTSIGVSGATVNLIKLSGQAVASTTTDGTGLYQFDVSALTETQVVVNATKAGYGFSSVTASIDKGTNSANVPSVMLTKIVTSPPVTVTTTTGGSTSTPSTESKTTTPVSISIPPGAVSTPTQITVAAIPLNSTPAPTAAANVQNQVGVSSLQPAGVNFLKPVTMTFPLPVYTVPGTQLAVQKLNTTTNTWEATTLKAVVGSDGLVATLDVTSTGQYALMGDISLTEQTVSGSVVTEDGITLKTKLLKETIEPLVEEYYGLQSGSRTVTKSGSYLIIKIFTSGQPPSDIWIENLYGQRRRVNLSYSRITYFSIPFSFNFPGLPANFIRNGLGYNPNKPNESGNWEYRWYIVSKQTVDQYDLGGFPPTWLVRGNLTVSGWVSVPSKTGWYWIAHNQGGIGEGPF